MHVHAASQQLLRSRDERGAVAVPEKKCGRYFYSTWVPEKESPGYAAEKRFALNVGEMAIDTITRCRTGRKLISQGIATQNSAFTTAQKQCSYVAPAINLCSICLAITERILSI